MLTRSTAFVLVLTVLELHSSESASLTRLPDVARQSLLLDASSDSSTFNEISVETTGGTPPVSSLGNIVAKHRAVDFQPTITKDSSRGRQRSPDTPPRDGVAHDLFGERESLTREIRQDRTLSESTKRKRSTGGDNQEVAYFPSPLINFANHNFASLNSYLPPVPSNAYLPPSPPNSYLPPTHSNSHPDPPFPALAPPPQSPEIDAFLPPPVPSNLEFVGDLTSNPGRPHRPRAP